MIRIRPSIVLFGDSITQEAFGVDGGAGWASMLSAAYTRRADVLNRGFSGYTTRHALDIVPKIFQGNTHTPSGENDNGGDERDNGVLFCTVFLGANDSVNKGELQHVPLQEYKENICKIVQDIRTQIDSPNAKHPTPIILVTPPPIDSPRWNAYCAERGWGGAREIETTQKYGQSVKDLVTDTSTAVVVDGNNNNNDNTDELKLEACHVLDAFELLGGLNVQQATTNLRDGLHLNSQGNVKFYEGLMDLIQTKLPNLAPMHDEDGEGKHGTKGGIPMEEKLWLELC